MKMGLGCKLFYLSLNLPFVKMSISKNSDSDQRRVHIPLCSLKLGLVVLLTLFFLYKNEPWKDVVEFQSNQKKISLRMCLWKPNNLSTTKVSNIRTSYEQCLAFCFPK